ncbi:ribonuclease H-like domain-containing protein [Dactylonectria estremocensis]|uniref:Ribonuclease H-like domain-containing protein n=1 Tax=Dactylonectria estremocensis TaxID=1079267 RepID=A0A9P9F723_9HYPO|nr:ribonuclease H-like domain-containing protein [Dactylonectria estremocensis]
MEPSQDFKSLQENIQKALVSAVKTVNRVAAEDLSFQRTVNPEVSQQLDDRSARILELSTRLLQSAGRACNVKAPKIEDAEDIEMNWRGVVDVVDSVLEKADTAMDEYTGLVKRKEPPTTDSATKPKKVKSTAKVIRNANISKPQVLFEHRPDNFPSTPWKPILTSKPHAKEDLEESLVTVPNETGTLQFRHPYETEISQMKYPETVYQKNEPIMYQPVETTQATWVDTYEGVLEMLEELKKAKEIAVDLEHHDYRTYVGLVSLMQVSTRDKDWIVDTLQPWRHKLEVLNEVFADPKIVKVFHGAYMDMVWLQRDLGLYVNGLFDTFFACELLYSGRSLAFLLSKFVDFDADKQYQLADWRIRPIPEEMLYYARSDTHYLLYIYDRVRNDLVTASDTANKETNLIERALERSRELSLSRHEHPGYNEETGEGSRGWYGYVFKNSHLAFDRDQFAVFKALWKWRDDTARDLDESVNYVLTTHTIADIARVNPPDAKALHSLLPLSAPLARPRFNQIWNRIKEVKAQGGPSLLHFFTSMAPDSVRKKGQPRVTKRITRLPDLDGEVTVSRLTRSQLFGDMPISTRWEETPAASDNQEDTIPFPWQRFVQEGGSESDIQHGEPTQEASAAEAQPAVAGTPAGNREDEELLDAEFTLKRGQKRKSEAVEDSSTSAEESSADSDEEMQADNGVLSIVDQPRKKGTKERRKERKAQGKGVDEELVKRQEAKKARKLRQQEKKLKRQEEKEQKKYEAVPFDYSKASSVMHAKRESNAGETEGKGRKKVFDPYSKSAESAVKGARKAPPVRGERSATFRK